MLMFEINKLISSEIDILTKVGWLLYNREDQNGGLSKNELDDMLRILTVEEMGRELQASYDEGFDDGYCPEE